MIVRKIAILFLVSVWPIGAAAAGDPEEGVAGTLSGPTDRVTAIDSFEVGLDVSDDDPELSVSYGGKIFDIYRDNQNAVAQTLAGSVSLDLPLGGESDLTDSAVLDGLSNGAKVSVSLSIFSSRFDPNRAFGPRFRKIMKRAEDRCVTAVKPDDAKAEEKIKNCREDGSRPTRDFAVQHSGYSPSTINRALYGGSWQIGMKSSLGFADFERQTPLTLEENKANKTQYAASIFGSYFFADALTSLTGEVEYQKGYEAKEKEVVCKAVVVTPVDDCANSAPAGPDRTENLVLRIENRRVFWSGFKGGELAIAPQLSYDVLNNKFGAELPIYYIPPGDWPISPGIKVGYSTKDGGPSFGAFLKTSFAF